MISYKKDLDLLGKIQKCGKVTPRLNAEDKETGFYSVTVSPPNVKYVTDLLDIEIGTWNYDMKYESNLVKWTIIFSPEGKQIKEWIICKKKQDTSTV